MPKLRGAYVELFDAALTLGPRLPRACADDVLLWAVAAASHVRLTRGVGGSGGSGSAGCTVGSNVEAGAEVGATAPPAGASGSGGDGRVSQGAQDLERLGDALCVLRAEKLGQGAPASGTRVGGTLVGGALARDVCLRRVFEALEAANARIKQPWARPHTVRALLLAKELGAHVWTPKERVVIDSWVSTARARGMLGQ